MEYIQCFAIALISKSSENLKILKPIFFGRRFLEDSYPSNVIMAYGDAMINLVDSVRPSMYVRVQCTCYKISNRDTLKTALASVKHA
jgi:hypothetical protein